MWSPVRSGYYENSDSYNAFTFNVSSGMITLNENIANEFDNLLASYRAENDGVEDYEVFIVLNFHIEKFRDISVAKDGIIPEEAQRIATMQSAHQAILQYTYEFVHAEHTQEMLSQVCYTVFITITSTAIVMGLNYGLEFSLAKLGASPSLTPLYSRGASYNLFKVASALVSEPLEEVFVDPVLDAYVMRAVAKIGGDTTAQILLSGLAESGRESLSGGISLLSKSGVNIDTQIQIQAEQMHALNPEISVDTHIQAIKETHITQQNKQDYITESLSTILMFTGAMFTGILGSVGIGFGTLLIGLGTSVEAIDSLKDMYKTVLMNKQSFDLSSKTTDSIILHLFSDMSEVRNSFTTLTDYQKQSVIASQQLNNEIAEKVNIPSDLLGNSKENSQEQIITEILNQEPTNILQKVKNFFKRHFAVLVFGHSMGGVFEHGDIARAKKVTRFSRYNIGDIIVFKMYGVEIIHQIVGTRIVNREVQYETKGVYNQEIDSRTVSKRDIIGKVDISKSELNILRAQISEGKTTIIEAFGMTEELEGILSVGERLHTKEGKVLLSLKQFLVEHAQFNEKLNNYIVKFNHLVDNNGKISRRDCKRIFKEIIVHFNEIGSTETYQNLIYAMAECNPYFWLDLNENELSYIEEYEPKFESYIKNYMCRGFDTFLNKEIKRAEPGYYHPDFNSVQDVQNSILKKLWGGDKARCSVNGELIKEKTITRHHYKLGDKNKIDCRISALVPVLITNHHTRGDPHRAIWEKRYTDAMFYIKQGLAYIPAWWTQKNRIAYKTYLEEMEIPYVNGRVK